MKILTLFLKTFSENLRYSLFFACFLCGIFGSYADEIKNSKIDSLFTALKKKIEKYNTSEFEKNSYATILEGLSEEGIASDAKLYQKLVFNLIAAAITDGKYKEAENLIGFLDKQIENLDFKYRGQLYYWKSLILYYNRNFKEADSYLTLAKEMLKKAGNNKFDGLLVYLKARIIRNTVGKKQAIPYYLESLKVLDERSVKYFYAVKILTNYYAQNGYYDKALFYINSAIQSNSINNNFNKSDLFFENIKNIRWHAHYLQNRAYIYREMAKSTEGSLSYLLKSLNDGQQSVIAIEKFKKQLNFESDILKINKRTEYIYFKGIEASSRLYKATMQDSLIVKMYGFAEMEKASALLRGLQKDIALRASNIPDSIVQKAYDLQANLGAIEAKRYEQKADYNIVDDKIVQSNSDYYNLVTEIENFEKDLESDYPEYKNNKYNVLEPNIDFVKNLSLDKNIIEYVLSDEKLYSILVSEGKMYFNEVLYDKGFKDSILLYHHQISDGGNLSFSQKEYRCFIELSNYLYQQLIAPFADKLKGKPLLIVPDNELSLIPFESLVQSPFVSKRVDYGKLPFLIKDYDISYTYSITLLEIQSKAKVDRNVRKVFAMAPGYNTLSNDANEVHEYRDSLGPLKGAEQEVELLKTRLKGKHYFNKEATEEEFKKNAGNYSVLHLAMHTLINDEEPLYSKMVFTPDADSVEDGLLNTYELRELNLNADLVVLSACNTGFGRISNGEGIIGLSRGFLQSGCRSLLATLWSVSDLISIDIINYFYKNMEADKDLAVSLSEAKRSYLEKNQGFYTHPFFWSGFIVIGNTDPIKLTKAFPVIKVTIVALLLLAIVLLLLLYKWKKPEGFRLPVKLNKRN